MIIRVGDRACTIPVLSVPEQVLDETAGRAFTESRARVLNVRLFPEYEKVEWNQGFKKMNDQSYILLLGGIWSLILHLMTPQNAPKWLELLAIAPLCLALVIYSIKTRWQ